METCPRDQLIADLKAIGACGPALAWLATLPSETTLESAWAICPYRSWMDWLRDAASVDNQGSGCLPMEELRKLCPASIPKPCEHCSEPPGHCTREDECNGCGESVFDCECDVEDEDDDWDDDFDDDDDEEDDDLEAEESP